jgi:hypothetical protein
MPLIPRSIAISEKLIVAQLFKKVPGFMKTEGSLLCSHVHLTGVYRELAEPIHTSFVLKIYFNIILPPTSRSPK